MKLRELFSFLFVSTLLNLLALGIWVASLLIFFGADSLAMVLGLIGLLR